jgi:hypothetical protein
MACECSSKGVAIAPLSAIWFGECTQVHLVRQGLEAFLLESKRDGTSGRRAASPPARCVPPCGRSPPNSRPVRWSIEHAPPNSRPVRWSIQHAFPNSRPVRWSIQHAPRTLGPFFGSSAAGVAAIMFACAVNSGHNRRRKCGEWGSWLVLVVNPLGWRTSWLENMSCGSFMKARNGRSTSYRLVGPAELAEAE